MSTIATHSRFGVNIQDLRERGIEVEVKDDYSDIELPEPQYGETTIGELTDDERALFAELYRTNLEIEGLAREYIGAAVTRLGVSIRQSDRNKPLHEAIKEGNVEMDFGSDENRLAFFRLQQKAAALHATLYWTVGERFRCHDWKVGVRSRFRLVKIAPRA